MESDPNNGAYCLDVHAAYGCEHSGACCTAGWPIPIEAPAYETVRVHFCAERALFETRRPLPVGAAAIVNTRPTGDCVFFEADGGRLCSIHRELGPAHLPNACRQFPRVVLHDARGLLISLSHFCPTAARLLLTPARLNIVGASSALALGGAAEGLDARSALPPLLRPGMLTDIEGYAAWESRALQTLARDDLTSDRALAAIDGATRNVQQWRPGPTRLDETVNREFDVASAVNRDQDLGADRARARLALASVPAGVGGVEPARFDDLEDGWQRVSRWWPEVDRAVRAYLAARLFGNWVAYHGQGLHAIVEYLRVALSVLKLEAARHDAGASFTPWQTVTEAVRSADLLLVHLTDPQQLARRVS